MKLIRALAFVVLALGSVAAWAQDNSPLRLKGLNFFTIGVCSIEAEKYLPTEKEMSEIVELKCRASGVRVVNKYAYKDDEDYLKAVFADKDKTSATIIIEVLQVSTSSGSCAYSIRFTCHELGTVNRTKVPGKVIIFSEQEVGIAPTDEMKATIKEFLEKTAEKLSLSYLRINEK